MKKNLLLFFLLACLTARAQVYKSIPSKIEAEDYVSMHGIGTEATSDENGGLDIGWIADSSWMDYNVNVAAQGYYTFNFRISNGFSPDARISLKSADGNVLGQILLPQTGGMQGWQSVSMIAFLPAGNQKLRVFAEKGIFGFNWFEVTAPKQVPGKIQAEHFDAMYEVRTEPTGDTDGALNVGYIDDEDWMDYNIKASSAGTYTCSFRVANAYGNGLIDIKNANGTLLGQVNVPLTGGWQSWTTVSTELTLPAGSQVIRVFANRGAFNLNWLELSLNQQTVTGTLLPAKVEAEEYVAMNSVVNEPTSDLAGGQNVGWIQDGSWMDYAVHAPQEGFYTFGFRIANGYSPEATLTLKTENGTDLGSIVLPQTGGMQGWKTVNMIAHLPAGNQTLRVFAEKGGWNFNWVDVSKSRPLSGKIEAETFDVSADIRTEPSNDTDESTAVSYIDDSDFLDYNVNVAQGGLYTFSFRISNSYGNGNIQIKNVSGDVLGQVDVPQTGGWQNWATIRTTATLAAGSQVLRIYANRGAFNFNWFEATPGSVLGQSVITFQEFPAKNVGDAPFDLIATSTNSETPIIFTTSNPDIVTVYNANGNWKATIAGAGEATITASQAGNSNFTAAENISRVLIVTGETNPSNAVKIAIDPKRWYQLTNASSGLEGFFDGNTQEDVHTGWGKIINNYEAYYPLLDGEEITLESIRFFDFAGSTQDQPMIISVIDDQWRRIPIATFTGDVYNGWVGPYPDRHLTGNAQFKLDAPVTNIRYIVMTMANILPTEIEFYGAYTPATPSTPPARTKNIRIKDLLGVNGYEWNFQDGHHSESLVESKVTAAKSFTGLRHYMDWEKLESREGVFSYNPTLSGSWNYDLIYERCKQENIEVLACLKTLSNWMLETYPENERDHENVPVKYGKDFADPLSYIEQSRVAFQYAARYGSNTQVDPSLLSVSTEPRWYGDYPNTVKIGLDLIKYIECDNERDKWWKGRKGYQTAREYAANLSAFYDGHKNTMGPAVGVKNADPNMKVVIAGLVTGPDYVKGMVDWCKEFRGYNPDGTVNLCWDIVNFHLYTDDASSTQSGTSTRGVAPEMGNASDILENFVKVTREVSNDLPVWITEAGYDISQTSPLKAIPIGNKSAMQTQADWILRTSLFSARNGIEKVFFYQMYDDNPYGGIFGSSGFVNDDQSRRPSADYFLQTKNLFGEYSYKETIHADPVVDRYELDGKSLFILVVPDETGRTTEYTLNLGGAGIAKIFTPKAGSNNMDVQELPIVDGKVTVTASETPMFVIASDAPNQRTAAETVVPTAVTGKILHEAVKVYPNPTADFINIDLEDDNATNLDIKIFDSKSGRLYKQGKVHSSTPKMSHKLDISQLPVGVYVIEIMQGNDRAFRKLVKVN
ncbi:carbohydrate-binding protein [Dyadobacter bucti]|uniref:carbohydrate-binding protein n=1 Tax=Dyadobacter bucti TaxID=2572203 RepID=UPI001108629A|nr:carbohydrate-binding protein [Dyadobacter bucti]